MEPQMEPLNVTIRELPPVQVAALEYNAEGLAGTYSESIGMLFREVEGWLRLRGYDTDALRRIGVPFVEGETLRRYWCCIEAPAGVTTDDGPVMLRRLAGGRYAVLTLPKDSATIGESIGRFHGEYVPANGLTIDATRSPYEVYYPDTMDYCTPIR